MTEPIKRRRWFRFSLRMLLVVITVLCVWLGIQVNAARRQRDAVERLSKVGGQFLYDYQLTLLKGSQNAFAEYGVDPNAEPRAPAWLRKLFGDDFFRDVSECGIYSGTISESDLNLFAQFSGLRAVGISDVMVISADSPIPRPINDLDIAPLGQLKNLQRIAIRSSAINGSFLEQMASAKRLTGLSLRSALLTDDLLKHLQNFKELRSLDLNGTRVSDDGLHFLQQMTQLKTLELTRTKVTSEGIRELQKSLPNCKIYGP